MARKCATALIAVLCLLSVGPGAFSAQCDPIAATYPVGWANALNPRGTPGPEMMLASRGKAKYVILLPAKPNTKEQKAAADLAQWLGQMTDAKFRIFREGGALLPDKVISVGETNLLREANPWQLRSSLGNEGYAISAKDGNLFLFGGKTRGIINAVYALLEEDLGCRWYDKQNATIPHIRALKFRPVPRKFVPTLEIRDPFYHDAFNKDWSLRNRTNAPDAGVPEEWGGHVDYALFVHTYDTLVPPKQYFNEHPEYYSEIKGKRQPYQLCLTNPDVLKIVVERVKEILKKKPNSEIISVSPNDRMYYCECANCKAIDDAEGTHAGTLIRFVNAVADPIAKDYPDVKISTLAYLGTFMPPKTIKPRDNVAIQLCTDSHAWTYPFQTVMETDDFQNAMKGWAAIGATMHIWDYTLNASHHVIPMPNMQVVTTDIRFYIRHNAKGVMLEGFYESAGTENVPMRIWVWAKQLWDPNLDTRELMRDCIFGYYGKAAQPIWEYNDLLWNIWEENHLKPKRENQLYGIGIRYSPSSAFLSEEFLDKSSALFAEAEALADDQEIMRRVKLAKLPILYVKLSQGIGYLKDWSKDFKPGTATAAERDEYQRMLDEFEGIVKAENITHILEASKDAENMIELWREKLAAL